MSRVCWWIGLTLLAVAARGHAQAPSAGMVGQSVRVSYWCSSPNTSGRTCFAAGPIESASDTTLRLREQSDGVDLIIPHASVRQVWVKDGTQGNFFPGAGLGLILGGAVGASVRSARWRLLKSTDAGLRVVRTRGGMGLGLSIGF